MYYARSENQFGERETLAHHLSCAAQLCASYLRPLGYESWGYMLGLLHDFGKYSKAFQDVLNGDATHVNHALPGAVVAYARLSSNPTAQKMIANTIASHHSSLSMGADSVLARIWRGEGPAQDAHGNKVSLFGKEAIQGAYSIFSQECAPKSVVGLSPRFSSYEDPALAEMLFARFLYSALVDADYSSAAMHYDSTYLENATTSALNVDAAMERLLYVREKKRSGSASSSKLNALRDQLFDDCVSAGHTDPGLFTLTAPTGLGKTLSLLGFALEHCRNNLAGRAFRRVILVLPYLSIIEQNVKDYRAVFPDLLEVHSNASAETARDLMQRWDAPCIVTTNVGFLEPLFSDQPSACRHLHHLSNSVIVFDEAQSLPQPLLEATLRSIKLLCAQYGCSVVFSTATQPSFQYKPGIAWEPREIVPAPQNLFNSVQRVTFDWRINQPTSLRNITRELVEYKQVCLIVNTKKHASMAYRALVDTVGEDPVFFITSDLCLAHRSQVLKAVQDRLADGLSCYLIATQCVEAGVDLDFPVVYRSLAPLESIIQAAGRCNRNGFTPDGRVVVFVPDETPLYPIGEYYSLGAEAVKVLASRHSIDCNNLNHIAEYYQILYPQVSSDKEQLRLAIHKRKYDDVRSAYKIIPNAGVQVVVPYFGTEKLFHCFKERYDAEGLTPSLIKFSAPFTVSSFATADAKRNCVPLLHRDKHTGQYEPTNFYLLNMGHFYSEKQGLQWDIPFDGLI